MSTTLGSQGAIFNQAQDVVTLVQSNPTALAAAQAMLQLGGAIKYMAGSSAGQVNTAYSVAALAVVAGAPQSLKFVTDGALVDALNNVINLANVKFIVIQAAVTNTANVVISGDLLNSIFGSTFSLTLAPGAMLKVIDPGTGWTVTGSAADTITITSASVTQTVAVLVGGC
jgi:hypothetical protein